MQRSLRLVLVPNSIKSLRRLTLNISNALLQNLLQNLGVLELLLDLCNDALGQLLLLADLDLSLISNPRIQDRLGLCGECGGLLELVCLGFKLGGFLSTVSKVLLRLKSIVTNLGDLEESLGDINDTSQLRNALNASLDGLGVVCTSSVQNALDLVDLSIGPFLVHWSSKLEHGSPDTQQAECDNGLLVDDIVFVAEGIDRDTGGRGEDGSLRDQGVAG